MIRLIDLWMCAAWHPKWLLPQSKSKRDYPQKLQVSCTAQQDSLIASVDHGQEESTAGLAEALPGRTSNLRQNLLELRTKEANTRTVF